AITEIAGAGGMVSLALSAEEADALISPWEGQILVAAKNGPLSTVVSGDSAALDALIEKCEQDELRARRIDVDYASHSPAVEQIKEQLLEDLKSIKPQ